MKKSKAIKLSTVILQAIDNMKQCEQAAREAVLDVQQARRDLFGALEAHLLPPAGVKITRRTRSKGTVDLLITRWSLGGRDLVLHGRVRLKSGAWGGERMIPLYDVADRHPEIDRAWQLLRGW